MQKVMKNHHLLLFLFFAGALFRASNAAYNVVSYGAKADAKTDSSKAFLSAWSKACSSRGPATVYVPRGRFLVKPVSFSGPCRNNKIMFRIDGTILAPKNYWSFGTSGFWILFYKVNGLTIYGGTVNANAGSFWACKLARKVCPPGARSISFEGCRNIKVSKLTSINSQSFHIAIHNSHNIALEDMKIIAPSWSPNTDGVHIQSSTGISVTRSTIMTGDDCISIGSASQNLFIQGIACGPGHGISIGSLGATANEGGVQNVTVAGVIFTGTQNGVRIKSWARPSNGFVKNVVFRNIVMKNTYNPMIIDQNYCPSGSGCPNKNSGVKISGVTYRNIRGTSATQTAMKFACSETNPCSGLKLQNINLRFHGKNGGAATSYCSHAHGSSRGIVTPRSCF